MSLAFDTTTQIYLFFAVAILCFFIAMTMDGVLGQDGFGVIGNQVITIAGVYIGVMVARHFQFPIRDLSYLAAVGLVGGFTSLFILSVTKAILARL